MNQPQHRLALPEGTAIHWYRIVSVLGKGGFGITYLAQDINLNKAVAIKEFLPTEFATRDSDYSVHPDCPEHESVYQWGLSRFIEEARVLSRFEHPNIVRVHTVFEENNTGYMVMAYEQGQSLKAILKQHNTLDQQTLLDLMLPILNGLEQVHQQQFIHRDIKPDNIYMRQDGSPVLLDFGSARQAAAGESRTMTSMVSPGFAPFEQYHSKSAEQGPWTDIYGLGATLCRAITGINPVDAVTRSHGLLDGKPDPQPLLKPENHSDYSPGFLAAVNHALGFRPGDRPQSIIQWRQQLVSPAPAQSDEPDATVVVKPALHHSPATRLDTSTPKLKLVLASAAVLVIILALGLSYGLMKQQQPELAQSQVADIKLEPETQQQQLPLAEQKQLEQQRLEQAQKQEQAQQQVKEEAQRLAELERQAAMQLEAERETQRQAEQEEKARKAEQQKAQLLALKRQQQEKQIAEERARFDARRAQKIDPYPISDYPKPKPLRSKTTIKVAANDKKWTSSGIELSRGQRYRITAAGNWKLGAACNPTDASGDGLYTLACWDLGGQTVAGYSHGALIGKIGKASLAFYVGPDFSFTAPVSGPLYLMSNEAAAYFNDNSGNLDVTISKLN